MITAKLKNENIKGRFCKMYDLPGYGFVCIKFVCVLVMS